MNSKNVKIWDLPTRLFHWSLVSGILFMWFSAEISDSLMDWHMRVGEFLLALVLFRISWGVLGSESARFTSFIKSPAATLNYAKTIFSRKPSWHAGHNPLGGWMVVTLLLVIAGQAVTGLFATDDVLAEGPLYGLVSADFADSLTGIHHLLFNVLTVLVAIHILAIGFYWIFKRTNLVKAMLSGSADWPVDIQVSSVKQMRSSWLGLMVFAVCYAFVHFGILWLAK